MISKPRFGPTPNGRGRDAHAVMRRLSMRRRYGMRVTEGALVPLIWINGQLQGERSFDPLSCFQTAGRFFFAGRREDPKCACHISSWLHLF